MRWVNLLLLVSVLSSGALFAEELHLKDGTKISGKIVAVAEDSFRVKTQYGDMKVPRSEIETIDFPENQSNKKPDTKPEAPAIDESLNGQGYTNYTGHFETTLPPGWVLAPELHATKDIVAGLKSADQSLFFIVTPEQFSGTISTYKVMVESQLQTKFTNYEKLGESDTKVDGKSALRLIFHGQNKDNNFQMKFVVYIIPYEGRMVRLTFCTLEPLFDEALPIFEKIAASYHTIKNGGTSG